MKKETRFLSGFADEAADDINGQIQAVKKLGWSYIEARSIDGTNINDLNEKKFDEVCTALDAAGIGINCFGSTIANWSSSFDEDFSLTMEAVKKAIRRMKRLSVPLIRIMSYRVLTDDRGQALPDQGENGRFSRVREICSCFLDSGITPAHENCHTYGGMSWEHTQRLLDATPGLKLVFDTGNPPLSPDFRMPFPHPSQKSYEMWEHLKAYVVHVHIKDSRRNLQNGGELYTFPGEGEGDVKRILKDILDGGYAGSFSIEPHMAVVFHNTSVQAAPQIRFENFVDYGKRTEALIRSLGWQVTGGKIHKPFCC